ncbi:hypothetical protein Tco_0133247 [Tanacetum coccineum]
MGDENPIRTLGYYSKPSHEGYRNTIELPIGNNVVPLQSDTIRRTIDQSIGGKLHDLNAKESWALLEDLALYDNESWNDLRDFAKPVKAIALPQDVPSKSDLRLIELENQVQRLMEAYLAPTQPTQVNKITTSYEICSGPHNTQYCMEDPEQAFVEYASSRTHEAGDVPSTSDRRLIELENQVQCLMEAHLAPTQPTQVNKITTPCEIYSGLHNTQYCMEDPEQAFVEYASSHTDEVGGLVSNFMASQDARLSKFEADFKRQQGEMTNKIDTVLKAIIDQIAGTLSSDTVKNPKLSTTLVLYVRSYPTQDPQCSNNVHGSINAITIRPKQPEGPQINRPDEGPEGEGKLGNTSSNPHLDPLASIVTEHVWKLNSMLESLRLVPQSSNTKFVYSKEDDGEVIFIEIIRDDDEPQNEGPNEGEGATTKGPAVEYFDTFPTRDELTYHKYLMYGPIPLIFLRNPIIMEGCPSNPKIPCNIGHVHRKLDPRENANGRVSNFIRRIKGMHVFISNFTYIMDFMIIEDISSIIDPRMSQVVLGKPFVEISNMTRDPQEGVARFTNGNDEVAYKMPHKIEQYNSLSNLEKEHTKSVYLRNEEDKRIGVEYVMSKILGFYKECLELGPKYLTGMDDEGDVT